MSARHEPSGAAGVLIFFAVIAGLAFLWHAQNRGDSQSQSAASTSGGGAPILQRWRESGMSPLISSDVSLSSAIEFCAKRGGVSLPPGLVEAGLHASGVDDPHVEGLLLLDKPDKPVVLALSQSALASATRFGPIGGVMITDRGTWYLNTGYQEFRGGPNRPGEREVLSITIMWLEK
jgi:hypothetical protein